MFAIIRSGGKQYRVQAGDTVRVAKLDKNPGDKFDLTEVLMIGGDKPMIGAPLVKDAKVSVTVVKQARDAKITVFKKKRRQGYRRTHGHRQDFTELFIGAITAADVSAKAENKAQVVDPAKKLARIEAHTAALKAAGGKALVEARKKKAAIASQVKHKKKAASHKKAMAKKAAPKTKKAAAKKTGAKKKASKKPVKK